MNMKVYSSVLLKQKDRAVIQAVFGGDNNIEWLVLNSRPVVDPKSVQTELDYIGNPDGTIRWLYPTGARRPLFLSTYNSPTKKAALYRRGISMLFRLGLARFARSGRILIQHAPEANIAELPIRISKASYAVFTGTVGPNRKAVIALESRGKVGYFAKVAIGPQASLLMHYEIHAQKKVAKMELKNWQVPAGSMVGSHTTVQENIATKRRPYSGKLSKLHLDAIAEMDLATRSFSASRRASFLTRVRNRMQAIERGPALPSIPRISAQLQFLFREATTLEKLPIAYSHGDFTPWNLYPSEDRLRVYDWEMAGYRPALFDCIHFIFQNNVLVERKPYSEIKEQVNKVLGKKPMRVVLDRIGLDPNQILRLYLLESIAANIRLFQKQDGLHPQAWWLMQTWTQALQLECGKMEIDSCRSHFLEEFSATLSGSEYAVMRGGESGLANLPIGSDLDILVKKESLELVHQKVAQYPMVLKLRRFRQSFMDRLEIHFVDGSFLSLDLLTDLRRKSLRMIAAEKVLERAQVDPFGIMRLSPEDQLEYAILFYGLNKHPIPKKYSEVLVGLSNSRYQAFEERLHRRYGLSGDSAKSQQQVKSNAIRLRKQLKNLDINRPSKRPRLCLQYLVDLTRRFFGESGMVITFSGVDGAGKSTILEATAEAVSLAYRRKVKVLRHRPSILPIISALRYGKQAAEKRSADQLPRQGTNRSTLSSFLRFAWYYVDYLFGQWYIWLFYQRRGYVVLYDRYYFDMIADPERSNLRLPVAFVQLAGRLIRKPTLNFLLTADPEAIRARKQELPLKDIRSLTAKYRELFKRLSQSKSRSQYFSLHNLGIDESVAQIMQAYRQTL